MLFRWIITYKNKNMIKTINEFDFIRAFQESDSRKDQFSYGALQAIFAYYEELEETAIDNSDTFGVMGNLTLGIELDIIATCCEFTEYDSALDCLSMYTLDKDEESIQDEDKAREWLEERTTVLDAYSITPQLEKVTSIVVMDF
jgi:hypothetical protein